MSTPPPVESLARLNVQSLLQQALEHNAGVEQLERLVALAVSVRAEHAREAWYASMAEFQRACPQIKKNASARITTARSSYSYSYASLDEILSTILPVLGPLGLSISWRSAVGTNTVIVSCRVAHKLGHHEDSGDIAMPIGSSEGADRGANAAQRVGIATTYAKRYSLLGIIGMAPEDDDDGGTTPARAEEERAAHLVAAAEVLRRKSDAETVEEAPLRTDEEAPKPAAPAPHHPATRETLSTEANHRAALLKLTAQQKREVWAKYCGDAATDKVDVAALTDLVLELRRQCTARGILG